MITFKVLGAYTIKFKNSCKYDHIFETIYLKNFKEYSLGLFYILKRIFSNIFSTLNMVYKEKKFDWLKFISGYNLLNKNFEIAEFIF